ncbi:hypothetical protein [Vulcanisaeta distributa]|nr:hypothetical protein [Vulcanisaeta distributa]
MNVNAIVLPGVGSFDAAMSRLDRFKDALTGVRGFNSNTWYLPWASGNV